MVQNTFEFIFIFMADSSEVKVNLGNKWHLLLASGPTVGDELGFHDSKIPSAEKVDLKSTVEVAAGLDSKLFIQVSFVFLHWSQSSVNDGIYGRVRAT